MPARERRFVFYRTALVLTLLLAAAALQGSRLLPRLFGAQALPLLPFVSVSAMCLGAGTGLAVGVAAGALWDAVSPGPDGLLALYLGAAGFLCGVLVRRYMRNSPRTALLLCFTAAVLFLLPRTLLYASYFDFQGLPALFSRYFLPNLLYTLILSLPVYILLKRLYSTSLFATIRHYSRR